MRRTCASDCSSWPTATVKSDGNATENRGIALPRAAENWPTARAREESQYNSEDDYVALSRKVMVWQTPAIADTEGGRMARSGERSDELLLKGQAQAWGTPTARDHKDGASTLENTPVNGLLGRQVLTATGPASPSDSGPRRLNPAFVEWLMGLPQGWTDFAPVETEFYRWQRLMRSELSSLPWRDA